MSVLIKDDIYLGDFAEDAVVEFKWGTYDANGGSITRAVNGTISVYIDDSVTQSVAGITDIEDFDTVTGVHHTSIDLSSDAFYAIGSDYQVVLTGATIAGQTVNCVLAHFSIENRGVAGAKAAWDRILSGGTHNIPSSAGRRLRTLQEFQGYENGAVWVDTVNGTSGTVLYENGTVENPSDNMSDALTIAMGIGLTRFEVAPASAIVLAAAFVGYFFNGVKWTLNLGGQNVSNSYFKGMATVNGTCTGAVNPVFEDTVMEIATVPNSTFVRVALGGTLTLSDASDYYFLECMSAIAGTGTPVLDFGAAVGNTNVNFRNWSGGIEIENMQAGDVMSYEGQGQLVINANCTGGTVAIRGCFTVTDNASGAVTLVDDARYDGPQVGWFTWEEILTGATHNAPTSAGRRLRDLASVVIHSATAQGPGTGNNQIQLDTGASAIDGAYDPSLVSIVLGTGAGQTRLILQYDGTTKTATVDRNWKVNPDATSEFIIIGNAGREHVNEGLAQGGTINTITLNTLASSSDNAYAGQVVFIRSGTGDDQARTVIAYDGTTKIATVHADWDVTPDTTSGYVMLPEQIYQAYENGAVWINTLTGTAGTSNYFNGVPSLPVDNLADALTMADSLGLTALELNASGIVLTRAFPFWNLRGLNWGVDLNGQDVGGSYFYGANVGGVAIGSAIFRFELCNIGPVSLEQTTLINCALVGPITFTEATDYYFAGCYSQSDTTPLIDFGAAVGNTTAHFLSHTGFVELQNMGQTGTDSCIYEGVGKVKLNANCVGGTLTVRGAVEIDDQSGGSVTITKDGVNADTVTQAAIKVKTDLQPAGVQKNVALSNFPFLMVLSSDHVTPATGLTVTAQVLKDGGSFANATNSPSEKGSGVYLIDWTISEMNADTITFKLTAPGADQRTIVIKTSS